MAMVTQQKNRSESSLSRFARDNKPLVLAIAMNLLASLVGLWPLTQ